MRSASIGRGVAHSDRVIGWGGWPGSAHLSAAALDRSLRTPARGTEMAQRRDDRRAAPGSACGGGEDVLQGGAAREAAAVRHLHGPGERRARSSAPSRRCQRLAVRRAPLAGVPDAAGGAGSGGEPGRRLELGRVHDAGAGAVARAAPRTHGRLAARRTRAAGLVRMAAPAPRGGGALLRRRASGARHRGSASPGGPWAGATPERPDDASLVPGGPVAAARGLSLRSAGPPGRRA